MIKIILHGDTPYQLVRIVPKHNFQNLKSGSLKGLAELWKEATFSDHVLQTEHDYLFCNVIETVEFEMID